MKKYFLINIGLALILFVSLQYYSFSEEKIDTNIKEDIKLKEERTNNDILDIFTGIGLVQGIRVGAGYSFNDEIRINGSYGTALGFQFSGCDNFKNYCLGIGYKVHPYLFFGFDFVFLNFNETVFDINSQKIVNKTDYFILPYFGLSTSKTGNFCLSLKASPTMKYEDKRLKITYPLLNIDLNLSYRFKL